MRCVRGFPESGGAGRLPQWPVGENGAGAAVVVGEQHQPVADREEPDQRWLTVLERGLYTGVLVCGAIGSGKTSACMRPFARQLLGWQAAGSTRRMVGLVLEFKGDFCHRVRGILEDAGRARSTSSWGWRALALETRSATTGSTPTRSPTPSRRSSTSSSAAPRSPVWQQAYVNLVCWIIELHRLLPERWATLREVYRCTLEPERIRNEMAAVEAMVEPPGTVRVRLEDLGPHGDEL